MAARKRAGARRLAAYLRRWRTQLVILAGIVLLACVGFLGAGWYYSGELKDGALEPDHEPDKLDLRVLALEDGLVTLSATSEAEEDGDWARDGVFGLQWEGSYGRVGDIVEIDDERVVREFSPMLGKPTVGGLARLDSFAFPEDPQKAHGIAFEEVTFTSPLGEFDAWFVDGYRDTWVIFVHGRAANRRESLRILPEIHEMGFPALVITYRNDDGVPEDPTGRYQYGKTEWQELDAAASYALDQGADSIVLVGYSMGGAVTASFLYRSPLSTRVVGVILDSPLLDFGAAVDHGASERGVPAPLNWIGRRIAALRFDIDWGELDYVGRAGELEAPILLFHGDDDDTAPVATSDALAEARPDIVTYVRVAGAGHVRSWNTDPDAYGAAVRDFLNGVTE